MHLLCLMCLPIRGRWAFGKNQRWYPHSRAVALINGNPTTENRGQDRMRLAWTDRSGAESVRGPDVASLPLPESANKCPERFQSIASMTPLDWSSDSLELLSDAILVDNKSYTTTQLADVSSWSGKTKLHLVHFHWWSKQFISRGRV